MSNKSYLGLSTKLQNLLEMSAEVVNSEQLEQTSKLYQKAIHAAGSEIVDINIQLKNMREKDKPFNKAKQKQHHEDLRLIGIIIGLLRTKMAILYGAENDFQRAIDLCQGATQVHKHQPALKG
jgi:dephospho-CoA kinase